MNKFRDDNTRLGDISYQLSRVADELRIIRELLGYGDLNISENEFNSKFQEKYGKS